MARSRNLSPSDMTVILELLDGWSGRLSWELLIEQIERRLLFRYTRQALHGHEQIASAFKVTKRRIRGVTGRAPVADPALQKSLEVNARLQAQVLRLETENERLIQKFVRWAYNAHLHGVGEHELERPLPSMGGRRGRSARQRSSER